MSNSVHNNRLAREKSPYLLQHQHNPVDWFPWGEEAFEKARAEDKPIFLSIGYSTCHWCHVMERESFEDEKVAEILNRHFVSIKVDREERPDVDQIYMAFVQATAGQGGWPLNCFLLPDLKPFYGGTYFAPDNRYGRPAFIAVLQQILALWADRREAVRSSAAQIHERLGTALAHEPAQDLVLNDQVLRRAGRELKKGYDSAYGGFGRAPKFPQPAHPSFLLRYGRRFNDKEAIAMALHTCERMAAGGICDQLGGGFARYSVDDRWLVPHFEKMLYDNAQLAQLYLDAFLISAEDRFAEVARDILKYVLRDMTHPEGGFYSAEDADSEGKEGKFYCWTKAEFEDLLPPEQFSVAAKYYGITEEGNFADHSDPSPLSGLNVLSVANPVLSKDEQPRLQSARRRLLAARSQRVRPHLDDKILASWNGLMLGSMARAAVVLDDETYRVAAEKNVAFLLARLWDSRTKTLFHRWREGEHDSTQLVQDYAFLLCGVLDLYQITLKPEHLETAVALAEAMIARFYDSEAGGFWQSQSGSSDLILSVKDDYDGALPSGNSAAALGLLKLAAITERPDFRTPAEKTLRLFADHLHNQPQAVPCLLQALDFWLQPPRRVVLAGPSDAPETWQLVKTAHSMYQPNCVVMGTAGPVDPFARKLAPQHGHPTAYVCHGNACQAPVRDCERLAALLRG